jgi:hypothetical protein
MESIQLIERNYVGQGSSDFKPVDGGDSDVPF